MTGYVRKDTTNNIADGNVINAADLDSEFDGVQDAFNASTGHKHDGTAGEGATINALGPTQDVTVSSTLLAPKTTNTVDIGSSALKFKDLFLAGNSSIGGTLAVTGVATLGAGAILNTPASVTLTNATGLPIATGVSGLGTGIATFLATPSSANLIAAVTNETGTGSLVFATSPTLVTPILGTPTSATLTNATGLPISTGVSGLGTGVATFLATPSSANLAAALTDETGSGANVFATSPTLVTPILGTPTSATLTNATGLPLTTGVTGTLPTANGGTNLTSFTSGGVVYASSSSALATGSALTFDGTNLGVGISNPSSYQGNADNLVVGNLIDAGTGITIVSGTASLGSIHFADSPTGDDSYRGFIQYDHTSNYLRFATDATERLRITSSSLYTASGINVGIGTSSPSSKLEVVGIGRFNGLSVDGTSTYNGQITLGSSATSQGIIHYDGNNASAPLYIDNTYDDNRALMKFRMRTAGTPVTAITIDASGNLGLGVTPSAWLSSTVAVQLGNYGSLFAFKNSGNVYLNNNSYTNSSGNEIYLNTAPAGRYRISDNAHYWYSAPSGTAGNAISFTQAMTLDASGNLGVGTTSPSGRLHVYTGGETTSRFDGSRGLADNLPVVTMPFWNVSNGVGDKQIATIGVLTGTSSNQTQKGQIYFSTSDGTLTERARIDSSGNLLVGTQTNTYVSRLVVSSSGGNNVVELKQTGTGSQYQMIFSNANGGVGDIQTSGSTTSYNTSSDYRLKNTIAPMTGALAKVALLKPCTYKWNADGSDGEGFIAHELAEVVPQCVSGEKDALNADGNPKYQGIDVSFLVATLTAAIQELKAEFDAYKASHP